MKLNNILKDLNPLGIGTLAVGAIVVLSVSIYFLSSFFYSPRFELLLVGQNTGKLQERALVVADSRPIGKSHTGRTKRREISRNIGDRASIHNSTG